MHQHFFESVNLFIFGHLIFWCVCLGHLEGSLSKRMDQSLFRQKFPRALLMYTRDCFPLVTMVLFEKLVAIAVCLDPGLLEMELQPFCFNEGLQS